MTNAFYVHPAERWLLAGDTPRQVWLERLTHAQRHALAVQADRLCLPDPDPTGGEEA